MARTKLHVKKGDTVLVIAGKSAGKKGKIIEVVTEKSRVVVEGVNMIKRHTKPTQKMPQGGIMEREAPIHSSNVMFYCGKCNRPARVAKKFLENGEKIRVCKKCSEAI